ncbi:flavoprotein [Sporomusa aerivorans]|uniref:flavoprotein n=1 Tax=Sporomusa aerivorans TaxID=204936 RepID=UPI00352A90A2
MNNELVEHITAEVVRQLARLKLMNQAHSHRLYKALIMFTGGTIGLEASLEQLKSIQASNVNFAVVFSEAAERIVGVTRVEEMLGAKVLTKPACFSYPGQELQAADIVLIPVLTQNTAAKLAYTLADSLVPSLVLQALMLGKPVVAAVNAADPNDDERRQKGLCKQSPALEAALTENLEKLQLYGIKLTRAENLAPVVQGILFKEPTPNLWDKSQKKKVLDAEAVRNAVLAGEKEIIIGESVIITPLALDVARELKAEIKRG